MQEAVSTCLNSIMTKYGLLLYLKGGPFLSRRTDRLLTILERMICPESGGFLALVPILERKSTRNG
jgi:hypothetical protein